MKIPAIQSKLPGTGETIFTTINSLAKENNAINLGQGFPDFSMNDRLIDLVYEAMRSGYNQYAHMNGVPALREAIAEKVLRLYQTSISSEDEITVTPGGTYAIYTALTSILQPDDEVIILEPAFDSYIPNVEINAAKPVFVPLTFPEYKIDWDGVNKSIGPKTKCIMINSPHNPSGSVLDKFDIEELRKVVQKHNIFILSDEVYEHIIFDNLSHESILRYPDLFERSFVCFSLGKVYSCTGWKIGYCVAPGKLMKEFRKVHQFNCFSCNTPMQHALSSFLNDESQYKQLGAFFQSKRDLFEKGMLKTKFTPLSSKGSYFQLYDYSRISPEKELDFAIRLCKQAGVACIPVSAFYKNKTQNKVVRFCFAKKEQTIKLALDRLVAFSNG